MTALDSFKVPQMDMWRREMYAAAGYRLYSYRNWRQRVKVQPSALTAGLSRRRMERRRGSRTAVTASSRLPPVLRSGDWGVMDAMGGAGGVLGGSMSSYEELGPAAGGAPSTGGAGAGSAGGGGVANSRGSSSSAGAIKRPLPSSGLVRPQRPSPNKPAAGGSSAASSSRSGSGSPTDVGSNDSSTSSMAEAATSSNSSSLGSLWDV